MLIVVNMCTPGERYVGFCVGLNAPSLTTHCPLAHVAVPPQRMLHPPQLFGSFCSSTHPDVQHDLPPVHAGPPLHVVPWHMLPTHMSPAGQAMPHPPQLAGSLVVSEQPVMQH